MVSNKDRIINGNFTYIMTFEGMEVYAKKITWQGEEYIQVVKYIPESDYVVSWNDLQPVYRYELYTKVYNNLTNFNNI